MGLPHENEYRRLKERAKIAARNDDILEEVLREIARYVIAELKGFGVSDGALCHWAGLPGYQEYEGELSAHKAEGRCRALHQRMWHLARFAGVAHESGGATILEGWYHISSEPLTRARASEVWKVTQEFQKSVERKKKEKAEAALEAKQAEWKATARPPQQVGAASIDDILGRKKEPNEAS
jgi:hypothetical protein